MYTVTYNKRVANKLNQDSIENFRYDYDLFLFEAIIEERWLIDAVRMSNPMLSIASRLIHFYFTDFQIKPADCHN